MIPFIVLRRFISLSCGWVVSVLVGPDHAHKQILHSLVNSQIGTINNQSAQHADNHTLLIAFLTPEFVVDQRPHSRLPRLHVRLHGVEGVAPQVVDQSSNEGGAHLAHDAGVLAVLFTKEVHHADVKPAEVHGQPRGLLHHRVLQPRVYLPEPREAVLLQDAIHAVS